MNIIARVLVGIMGGFMKKPRLPAPKKIILGSTDAAIVFRYNGAHFVYPEENAKPPQDLLDTLNYMRYALERKDWLEQFKDEEAWQQAITNLATEECAPVFEVIEGGLAEPPQGPYAKKEEK